MKMKKILTKETVKDFFTLCDGDLVWKERPLSHFKSERSMNSWNSRLSKKIAGNVNNLGYIQFEINLNGVRERYLAHRVVWLYVYGEWPSECIDHIDRNKSNNRIENLRDVSQAENNRNRPISSINTSGVSGVSWNKSRGYWEARIRTKNGRKFLGGFHSPMLAIETIEKAKEENNFHKNHGVLL